MRLTFTNSIIVHLGLLGLSLFTVLGGYGLAYAPMEMLNAFLNKP
jgi:hypothetical protein